MTFVTRILAATAALTLGCGAAQAQETIFKLGLTRYDTHSKTDGVYGIGVPSGADATTGDATTAIIVVQRMFNANVGAELVLGIPPKIDGNAAGSMAFLGKVFSARSVSPTLLLNYRFGVPGDKWRPYVGAGVNFTRFTDIRSSIAPDVRMSDSWGPALQAGVDYAIDGKWGLFASVAALKVKSDLMAIGTTVLTTTIDFRPLVYSAGVTYRY